MIPRYITLDMQEMDAIQASMPSDVELGAWFRSAVRDMRTGCVSPNTDIFIREQYEISFKRMINRQKIDANNYNRKSRQEAATRKAADESLEPSCATFEDAANGNVPDETAKSSFVAIVDDRSCKSGKSGDVAQAKRPYGEFGHVMLTEREGNELRKLYGNDLKLAIDILDSYIENGGKAAKKYKSHYLVMRKGNWVWQKVQDTKLAEKRLENANRKMVNFKAEERERTARMLRGEDMDGKNYVRDEDLTPEELERKYG